MTFTITHYPEQRVVVGITDNKFDFGREGMTMLQRFYEIIESIEEPIVYIFSADTSLQSFQDLLEGTRMLTSKENEGWRHPKIKQLICVTNDELLRMSMPGFNTPSFGNLHIPVCTTLEEAFDLAQTMI